MQFKFVVSFIVVVTTISANLLADTQLINVNVATAQELDDALPGIGPSKAVAIVNYRTQHGAFKSLDDLDEVPGIGPKILEGIQDFVQFEDVNAIKQQQPQQHTQKQNRKCPPECEQPTQ